MLQEAYRSLAYRSLSFVKGQMNFLIILGPLIYTWKRFTAASQLPTRFNSRRDKDIK